MNKNLKLQNQPIWVETLIKGLMVTSKNYLKTLVLYLIFVSTLLNVPPQKHYKIKRKTVCQISQHKSAKDDIDIYSTCGTRHKGNKKAGKEMRQTST